MSAVMEAREPSAKYLNTLQPPLVPHFELMATAPGGVGRLRELILTLAVQGKLVPQDPRDEPASELLKKIRAEKERLVAIGSLKKEKRTASQTDEDLPAVLPRGWAACRLSQLILSIRSGGTPSKQNSDYWDGDIPWASVKDLRFGEPISDTQDKITKAGLDAGSELAPAGSILICTRMGLGKIGEALVDIAINQDLKAVQLGIGVNKQYFINYFKTLPMVGSGMTVAGIKQDELLSFVVPLPPAAEQARIVTRVEELMRLCDALEAKGQLEAAQHAQLVQTLLGALTASTSPEELAENWQRVATHFDSLLDRPEAIDALEQTILQLAVRGLLVPQDPKDEPASELLKKIRAEKDRLLAKSNTKQSESFSEIKESERPFDVPLGWDWVRMGDLIEGGSGTTPLRARTDYFAYGTEMWVKTTDLNNAVVTSCEELITKTAVMENRLKYFPVGTVCVAMYGGAGTIGKSGVLGVPSTINQSVFALPPAEGVDSAFLHIYVISVRSKWMSFAAGLRKDLNP